MEGERAEIAEGDNLGGGDVPLESSVPERPKLHPLLMEPVLAKLFEYLPHEELAECRLVCRQWHNECLSTWRTTSTLQFVGGELIGVTKWKGRKKSCKLPLSEFLDFWDNECLSHPFRQFHLDRWVFLLMPVEVDRFWKEVGKHMTRLTLTSCYFDGVGEVQKVLYQACPNLQFLRMDWCKVLNSNYREDLTYRYDIESDQEEPYEEPTFGEHRHLKYLSLKDCLPDSWVHLLSHFTSLTSLVVFTDYALMDEQKILKAIKVVREQDGRKLPLANFSIPIEFYEAIDLDYNRENFQLLHQLRLPLQCLQAFILDETSFDEVRDVVQNHSTTLTRIDISNCSSHPRFDFPFGTRLANLQQLHIEIGIYNNLEFLKYSPNLQKLEICGACDAGRAYMFSSMSNPEMRKLRLLKLTELILDFELREDQLRCLVKWMPNVEKLKTHLTNGLLSIVCGSWEHLRELKDMGNKLTDEGIAGMQPDGGGDIQPNITVLKKMVSFWSKSKFLTEVSATDGFLKLPCLERLYLDPEVELGDGADELRDKHITIHAFQSCN